MVKRTIRIAVANDQLKKEWRVARAFDLSGIRSTEGAPSFALLRRAGMFSAYSWAATPLDS